MLSTQKGSGRRRLDQQFRESFVHIPAKITKSKYVFRQLLDLDLIVYLRNSGNTTNLQAQRVNYNDFIFISNNKNYYILASYIN